MLYPKAQKYRGSALDAYMGESNWTMTGDVIGYLLEAVHITGSARE